MRGSHYSLFTVNCLLFTNFQFIKQAEQSHLNS